MKVVPHDIKRQHDKCTLLNYRARVKVSIFQKERIVSIDGEFGMFKTHLDVIYVVSWLTPFATTFRK